MYKFPKIVTITFIWLVFQAGVLPAQNTVEESKKLTQVTSHSNNKIDSLNNLSYTLRRSNTDSALYYANEALTLSESNSYTEGKILALSNAGLAYQYKSAYDSSLKKLQKAIKILDLHPNKSLRARVVNNLGNLFWRLGDREQAYKYYKEALVLRTALQDSIGMAKALGNLGNAANAVLKDLDTAALYYNQALEIFEALKDTSGLSITYTNLGNIESANRNYDKAIRLYHKSLRLDLLINDLYGASFAYSNLSNTFILLDRPDSAIFFTNKLMITADKLGSLSRKKQAYRRLYQLYEQKEVYEKAIEYLKLYHEVNDSLASKDLQNRMVDLRLNYDNELKQKEIDLFKSESETDKFELAKNTGKIYFCF